MPNFVKTFLICCLSFAFSIYNDGALCAQNALSISSSIDSLSCHGASTASIHFSIAGGQAPYSYTWKRTSNSFVFEQGSLSATETQTISSLGANGYIIEAIDENGLTLIDTIHIIAPDPLALTAFSTQELTCYGVCDAIIELQATGGTGDLQIIWADTEPTDLWTRTGLCTGTYFFSIVDENGCSRKGAYDFYSPDSIAIQATQYLPSCVGAADGSLSISLSGGTAPLSFEWAGGSQVDSLSGLASGLHPITVTDGNGCVKETNLVLEEGLELAANMQINYACGDGAVVVSAQVLNGQAPYAYQWSTASDAAVLTGAVAGNYNLTLTDANACSNEFDVSIDYVAPIMLDATLGHLSCPNATDGSISIQASGGLPPYQYNWSNGSNGTELTNLPAGSYMLNFQAASCGISQLFTIEEPQAIQANFIIENDIDVGLKATALITGGTSPYSFEWSNGQNTNTATHLELGQHYELIVRDANGCQATFNIQAQITQNNNLLAAKPMRLYPNPASDFVQFLDVANAEMKEVTIYQSTGQLLAKHSLGARNVLDVSSLPPASYIVLLHTEAGVYTARLLVL